MSPSHFACLESWLHGSKLTKLFKFLLQGQACSVVRGGPEAVLGAEWLHCDHRVTEAERRPGSLVRLEEK